MFTLEDAQERDEAGGDVNSWREKNEQWQNGDGKKRPGLQGLAFTHQSEPQLHLHCLILMMELIYLEI